MIYFMQIIDNEAFNTNYDMCKICGGKCCKRNACDCSPEDFTNDISKMRAAIESGNYSIDFSRDTAASFVIGTYEIVLLAERVIKSNWEFFYIRPKNIGRPAVDIIHGTDDEGPCIFWTEERGCPLKYKEKPKGGRTLIPYGAADDCIPVPQYNKALMRLEWKPFTKYLMELAKDFWDPTWELYSSMNLKIK